VMRSAMVGLLVYCLGTSPLFAAEELIDPEHSSLIVHVGKSGFTVVAKQLALLQMTAFPTTIC
jgi:hypothetical protein